MEELLVQVKIVHAVLLVGCLASGVTRCNLFSSVGFEFVLSPTTEEMGLNFVTPDAKQSTGSTACSIFTCTHTA